MLGQFYLLTVLYSLCVFVYVYINKRSFKERISLLYKYWGESKNTNYPGLVVSILFPVLNTLIFTLLLYILTCSEDDLENLLKNTY